MPERPAAAPSTGYESAAKAARGYLDAPRARQVARRLERAPRERLPSRRYSDWGKRLLDVAAVVATLPITLPLLGVLALAIRLDSRGPALFRQRRFGRGGREFTLLKFRTMVQDAQGVLEGHLAANEQHRWEWAETQKLRKDPRITRVGRVLRKFSLDELPQLLNVLRGDMSLVGPRPIIDEELERYGSAIDVYHQVRPGLTGLWQVSGRNDLTYEQRVRLDVQYVRTRSFRGDLRLLLRTPRAVLRGRGAY